MKYNHDNPLRVEEEIWKPVMGYEGYYEVSNLGRVRSSIYGILKPQKINSGYLMVGLRCNGKRKRHLVHRLVAQEFCQNSLGLSQVNHKNEDKTDNRAVNLEWCTAKYNNNYGTGKQRLSLAQTNNPKLSFAVVMRCLDGTLVRTFPSANEAARSTGIGLSNIVRCCNKKKYYHTAGGYKWEYANE